MISFRRYLIENIDQIILLLENKKENYIARWMKVHSEHPLVLDDPEVARELISHGQRLGSSRNEHHFVTGLFLDGILKPVEDDPTVRDKLGGWRRLTKTTGGLYNGKGIHEHSYDEVANILSTQVQKTYSPKAQQTAEDIQQYHIGTVHSKIHGPLQVYRIHKDMVPEGKDMVPDTKGGEDIERPYHDFSRAMKRVCPNGSTVCVQHGGGYVKEYARDGTGFMAYLNSKGHFVYGHGYSDRGIVNHKNNLLPKEEAIDISDQTYNLLDSKNKVHYLFSGSNLSNKTNMQLKALEDPDLDKKHISRALGSPHESVVMAALNHPKFGTHPYHITSALQSPHESVAMAGVNHPNFERDHIFWALKSPHESVAMIGAKHPDFETDPDHIGWALKSPHKSVAMVGVNHPNFETQPDHITSALQSPHESIVMVGVKHSSFGTDPDHITSALQSPHESVAMAGVNHPNFGTSPYHIFSALRSENESLIMAALNHPSFGTHPQHISKALVSPRESVAMAALNHPNFGTHPLHISAAVRSPHESVAMAGVNHPNFGTDPYHITSALQSPHESVATAARKRAQE